MKLTPKQNAVIYCLQNGWILITDMEMKGALVANNTSEFRINNGLFWRLVTMDLIYQQNIHPFNFVLTNIGKTIPTKAVTF